MAGRGDEAGLRQIGRIGLRLRLGQFGIEAGQFRRALDDPALERFVGALQGFGGHQRFRWHR